MTEKELFVTVSVLSFLAVVALINALYSFWRLMSEGADPRISRRMRRISAGGGHGKDVLTALYKKQLSSNRMLNYIYNSIPRIHALDALLERANIGLSVSRFILLQISLSIPLVFLAFFLLHFPWALAIPAGVAAGFALPALYATRRAHKRMVRLVTQLPEMMDFIARALRAGNSFSSALKEGASELRAPVATELGIIFDEMNYGLEIEDALYNFADRTGNQDVGYFVAAVLIQRTTGGNLADLLNRLAEILRERERARGEVDINAGEMRLTARVLIGLPFVAAFGMFIIQPDYMRLLWEHPLGQMIIAAQIVLMIVGYLIVRKMINFRI